MRAFVTLMMRFEGEGVKECQSDNLTKRKAHVPKCVTECIVSNLYHLCTFDGRKYVIFFMMKFGGESKVCHLGILMK